MVILYEVITMQIEDFANHEYNPEYTYYYVYVITRKKINKELRKELNMPIKVIPKYGHWKYYGNRRCKGSPFLDTDYMGSSRKLQEDIDIISTRCFDKEILAVYTTRYEAFTQETQIIQYELGVQKANKKLFLYNVSDNQWLIDSGLQGKKDERMKPPEPTKPIIRKKIKETTNGK